MPLIKNELKPLAKSDLITLGLTAASATDTAFQKNILGLGITTLIISNEEMDIMKTIKSLEKSTKFWIPQHFPRYIRHWLDRKSI